MNKFAKIFAVFLLIFVFLKFNSFLSSEPDCDNPSIGDIEYCLTKIQDEINALTPAHENNKKELSDLNAKISSIKKQISNVSYQIDNLEEEILRRDEELSFTKKTFDSKAYSHYKFIRSYDPLLPFFSSKDATNAIREIILQQKAADNDRVSMESLAHELSSLKLDKENFEKQKTSLASAQKSLDERASFLGGEVNKVESYLTTLSSRQKELVALKEGGFSVSIGDTPPTLEPCSGPPGSSNFCDPGFRPAFAAFSFGAPHRVGMSQYGAYGRSKSGQSAETILSAYYQGANLDKNYSAPSNITVSGIGTVSFEDNYLLGIYEVPESWGDNGGFEALKAQAVAARSYALAITNNGQSPICTTESCQVYKPQLKSGKWAEAVRATRGWVLTVSGSPAKAYYSSTTGGYTISNWGWSGIKDTSGDWPDTAYEKIAGSPWFYKAWYKSRGGASCGYSNPWLSSEQMADLINAWYAKKNSIGDVGRISPTDTGCWGGNPYSISELQAIGGYNSVSSISVVYSNNGTTNSVTFGTNKGNITINGSEVKEAFNLRAPGYIGIKSELFNIEKI